VQAQWRWKLATVLALLTPMVPQSAQARPVETRLAATPDSRIDSDLLDGANAGPSAMPARNWLVARPQTHAQGPSARSLRDDPIGRIIAARMKRSDG